MAIVVIIEFWHFQGFVITLPYCFLNTEVRGILRQHFERWKATRWGGKPTMGSISLWLAWLWNKKTIKLPTSYATYHLQFTRDLLWVGDTFRICYLGLVLHLIKLNQFVGISSLLVHSKGPPHLLISHQRAVHKRKISKIVSNTNTYFVFNCNVLALFTFYAPPSGGKLKGAVVHCWKGFVRPIPIYVT